MFCCKKFWSFVCGLVVGGGLVWGYMTYCPCSLVCCPAKHCKGCCPCEKCKDGCKCSEKKCSAGCTCVK